MLTVVPLEKKLTTTRKVSLDKHSIIFTLFSTKKKKVCQNVLKLHLDRTNKFKSSAELHDYS